MAPQRNTGREEEQGLFRFRFAVVLLWACYSIVLYRIPFQKAQEAVVPDIKVASMDFTVNWNFSIKIPEDIPQCLQGDIQASLLYKNVTLATSSKQSYNNLELNSPQQVRVSTSISEEDIGGVIGNNIFKDIHENREVKFGSQLFLTDCRENSTGVLSYVCDETTLRFEQASDMKVTAFRNNPTCVVE
ncbi:unnamed protein product [Microthlaspi erraticum]|uniref:Late embryogenesis abundant protein LEA-2 subgroup domain-containing protein n=1 Tax=Microthlaspi erraticum TaxID=1685480 RepID=A0A6D2HDZ3_9BRAS|nr:unnamed protein product [Microthlaspi erraticum]